MPPRLLPGFGNEGPYIDTLLTNFAARRTDAADFAHRYRVVLIRASSGAPIDISLGLRRLRRLLAGA